jgi:hypothetical protein
LGIQHFVLYGSRLYYSLLWLLLAKQMASPYCE